MAPFQKLVSEVASVLPERIQQSCTVQALSVLTINRSVLTNENDWIIDTATSA
jgi:hypothetical protein